MRSFMLGIPPSLVEAARVDGAGLVRAFLSIVVPISRNSLITVGLFAFIFAWGDFVFALTLTTKGEHRPGHARHLHLPRRTHLQLERGDGHRHARLDPGDHPARPRPEVHLRRRQQRRGQVAASHSAQRTRQKAGSPCPQLTAALPTRSASSSGARTATSRSSRTSRPSIPTACTPPSPQGIAENLGDGAVVSTTTLDEPEHGLTEEVLADTDVLVWWGHAAHGEVADEVVERVHRHVLSGMGLVVLHSGHWSKIFGKLMGTTCTLRWRSEQDRELVWTVNPTHPIAQGVPNPIIIDAQEMYGEFFDIPAPDELIFISSFTGGEVFRSRLHVPARPRQDLLLLPRRPGLPGLPPHGRPPGDRQRRRLGQQRPAERALPTLLRYETDDFFNGHGYTGPIEAHDEEQADAARRLSRLQDHPGRRRRDGPGLARRPRRRPPDVELVGLVDLDLSAARRRRPSTGLRRRRGRHVRWPSCSTGWQRTPSSTSPCPAAHRRSASRRCVHGLPVLCEKPLADTVGRRHCRWSPPPRSPASC